MFVNHLPCSSYVILEIGGIYQRDAGLYTCKAINKHGEATVSCTLTIKVRATAELLFAAWTI